MATALQHTCASSSFQTAYNKLTKPGHPRSCPHTHPLLPVWQPFRNHSLSITAPSPLLSKARSRSLSARRPLSSPPKSVSITAFHNEHSGSLGAPEADTDDRPTRKGRVRPLRAIGGTADAGGESTAGSSGRQEGGRSMVVVGGPFGAVLGAVDSLLRFVIVKTVLVLHRVLLLGIKVVLALWRILPVRAVERRTLKPILESEGVPTFKTPWFLKPIEFLFRIALFFVPSFVKRRVGPVVSRVVGTTAERTVALIRKGAKEGLRGVRDWAGETYEMAREGAPEARHVVVQVLYRILQVVALVLAVRFLRALDNRGFFNLGWLPNGIVKLWRWMWVAIDYTILDMDWVQPLQRLIGEHLWPLWRDYWILMAMCYWIVERIYPTLLTEQDIYEEDQFADDWPEE